MKGTGTSRPLAAKSKSLEANALSKKARKVQGTMDALAAKAQANYDAVRRGTGK